MSHYEIKCFDERPSKILTEPFKGFVYFGSISLVTLVLKYDLNGSFSIERTHNIICSYLPF